MSLSLGLATPNHVPAATEGTECSNEETACKHALVCMCSQHKVAKIPEEHDALV